jgi:intermediate peptidase
MKSLRWSLSRQLRKASTLVVPSSNGSASSPHDEILRKVFDQERFWNDFSSRSRTGATEESSGLIKNKYLKSPDGFLTYARDTTRRCQRIVERSSNAKTVEDFKRLVRDLDRLSDLLCRVIDLSDFIRSTHPSPKYQMMANQAYTTMYEYMNQLNTATALNENLKKAIEIPEVYNSWTEEERTVAKILIKDFSKSAIDLPDQSKKSFVDLSNQILDSGSRFVDYMEPQKSRLKLLSRQLKGMSPMFFKSYVGFTGSASIPSASSAAYDILAFAQDPNTRYQMFLANRTASDKTVSFLEQMLLHRSELAKLAGYESYGHMALSDKMAQSPEAVNQFLSSLNKDAQNIITQDIQQLLALKRQDSNPSEPIDRINAWDKDFYVHALRSSRQQKSRISEHLSEYFSLGTVFQGLSRLFSRTYGIRLVPKESLPGETWHEEVRRLDVVDESDRTIAVMYCDLFSRAGKSPNPAHFTLRCSRVISEAEISEYAEDDNHPFSDSLTAATEGIAYSHDPTTKIIRQLPTIALICDFHRGNPTLLPLRDVQTMFHEMGHALHSILGQTSLQNVAGTRCATDLAEVPSVMMERFALAPSVLGIWARHYSTDKPLPYELIEQQLNLERNMKQGLDTEDQIMMARLDQSLHSKLWCDEKSPLDSTAVYHAISSMASIPDPSGSKRQGFFGHLYGYGATYYSYLFARSVAGKVWREVFDRGNLALDRNAGEKLRGEFLGHGGSRDGWKCIAGLVGDDRLADGGKEAMKIVGEWGVQDDNTDVHLH